MALADPSPESPCPSCCGAAAQCLHRTSVTNYGHGLRRAFCGDAPGRCPAVLPLSRRTHGGARARESGSCGCGAAGDSAGRRVREEPALQHLRSATQACGAQFVRVNRRLCERAVCAAPPARGRRAGPENQGRLAQSSRLSGHGSPSPGRAPPGSGPGAGATLRRYRGTPRSRVESSCPLVLAIPAGRSGLCPSIRRPAPAARGCFRLVRVSG